MLFFVTLGLILYFPPVNRVVMFSKREAVDALCLEEFKARLDGVLGILIWWVAALPMEEIGTTWALCKVPSNLSQPVTLFCEKH